MRRLLLCALLLSACSHPYKIQPGDLVTDKTFVAAHTDTSTTMVCTSFGQYGCMSSIPVTSTTHYDDAWYLVIGHCNAKHCDGGTFEVTHQVYEQVLVGDEWHTDEVHGAP